MQSSTFFKTLGKRCRERLPPSWQLNLEERSLEHWRRKILAEAATSEERQQVDNRVYFEWTLLQDKRKQLISNGLVHRAEKFRIRLPDFDGEGESSNWERNQATGGWYLSTHGVSQVRSALREEERWLLEKKKVSITRIAAMTGLVGALAGLAAVIKEFVVF